MSEHPPFKTSAPLTDAGFTHGFFGREGGVSTAQFSSLNAGAGSADPRANVIENRARIARAMGTTEDMFISAWQHHSRDVIIADAPWPIDERPKGDAIITTTPGLALGALAADCGPVLFADTRTGRAASCHAGWRGAVAGVTDATVDAMEKAGSKRADIIAVLGPCISQDNYQVGAEMKADFTADDDVFFAPDIPGKFRFDLKGYVLARLRAAGIGHCEALPDCTYGQPTAYFSYRYNCHNGVSDYGRNVSVIRAKC